MPQNIENSNVTDINVWDMLRTRNISDDGNCFYHAVATAINYEAKKLLFDYKTIKLQACDLILEQIKTVDTETLHTIFHKVCTAKLEKFTEQKYDLEQHISTHNQVNPGNTIHTTYKSIEDISDLNESDRINVISLADIDQKIKRLYTTMEYATNQKKSQ
jgi:hypothetical protein